MIDAQTDALDKMDEAFKEEKDEEIKKLEETASSYQKRWDQAIAYIEDHYDTLYQELIDWNYKIGDSLSTDIQKAWADAEAAVQHYGSVAEAVMASITAQNSDSGINNIVGEAVGMSDVSYSPKSSGADIKSGATDEMYEKAGATIAKKIYDMKTNSASYMELGGGSMANASSAQRGLIEKNDQLADEIGGLIGAKLTRGNDGVWRMPDGTSLYSLIPDVPTQDDIMRIGRKYAKFHSGGIVGGFGDIKQNEQLALLRNKEWVLSERMVKNLSEQMDRIKMLKDTVFKAFIPPNAQPLLAGADISPSAMSNINNNQPVTITIGDTIINGENGNALSQHKKVSEDMVNQIARMLGVRR